MLHTDMFPIMLDASVTCAVSMLVRWTVSVYLSIRSGQGVQVSLGRSCGFASIRVETRICCTLCLPYTVLLPIRMYYVAETAMLRRGMTIKT